MRCFIVLQVLWVVTGDSKMTKTKPSLILKELTQGKDDAKGKQAKELCSDHNFSTGCRSQEPSDHPEPHVLGHSHAPNR